jgi:hypothetical protein
MSSPRFVTRTGGFRLETGTASTSKGSIAKWAQELSHALTSVRPNESVTIRFGVPPAQVRDLRCLYGEFTPSNLSLADF